MLRYVSAAFAALCLAAPAAATTLVTTPVDVPIGGSLQVSNGTRGTFVQVLGFDYTVATDGYFINYFGLSPQFVAAGSGHLSVFAPTVYALGEARISFVTGMPDIYIGPFTISNVEVSGPGQIGFAVSSGAPEPATWAMLLLGFGLVGLALRLRHVNDDIYPVLGRAG